jgi:hypothetical protein
LGQSTGTSSQDTTGITGPNPQLKFRGNCGRVMPLLANNDNMKVVARLFVCLFVIREEERKECLSSIGVLFSFYTLIFSVFLLFIVLCSFFPN